MVGKKKNSTKSLLCKYCWVRVYPYDYKKLLGTSVVNVRATAQEQLKIHIEESCTSNGSKKGIKVPKNPRLLPDPKKRGEVFTYIVADIEVLSKPVPGGVTVTGTERTYDQSCYLVAAAVVSGGVIVEEFINKGYDDPLGEFLRWLLTTSDALFTQMADRQKDWRKCYTPEQIRVWGRATICVYCNKVITDDDRDQGNYQVHAHNHFTSQPQSNRHPGNVEGDTGYAHRTCNISDTVQEKLVVYTHNMGFDLSFMIERMASDVDIIGGREVGGVSKGADGKFIEFILNHDVESETIDMREWIRRVGRSRFTYPHTTNERYLRGLLWRELFDERDTLFLDDGTTLLFDVAAKHQHNDGLKTYFQNRIACESKAHLYEAGMSWEKKLGGDIVFKDSMAIFGQTMSLDKIVGSRMPVQRKKFKDDASWHAALRDLIPEIRVNMPLTSKLYPGDDEKFFSFVLKGWYPHALMDSVERLKNTCLPAIDDPASYSMLSNSYPSPEIYDRMQYVVSKYCGGGTENALDRFARYYCRTDVVLTCDCLQYLIELIQSETGIHPVRCMTGPQLAWQGAMFKCQDAGYQIELFTDRDMVSFTKAALYGGIVFKGLNHVKANCPGIPGYDPTKDTVEIFMDDVCSLYGYIQMHRLPCCEYTWATAEVAKEYVDRHYEKSLSWTGSWIDLNDEFVRSATVEFTGDYMCEGCFAEGHQECQAFYGCHDCARVIKESGADGYGPFPRKYSPNAADMSAFDLESFERAGKKPGTSDKLIMDLHKKRYTAQVATIVAAKHMGFKVLEYHKCITFGQDFVMKPWADFTAAKRKEAKVKGDAFGDTYFKWLLNVCYGVACTDVTKFKNSKLLYVGDPKYKAKYSKCWNNPNFEGDFTQLGPSMLQMHFRQPTAMYNKPMMQALGIQNLSKVHMLDIYRTYRRYGARPVYGDTDSLVLYIRNPPGSAPTVARMYRENPALFDLSGFENALHDDSNAKRPGAMESEYPVAYTTGWGEDNGLKATILAEFEPSVLDDLGSVISEVIVMGPKSYRVIQVAGKGKIKSKGLKASAVRELGPDAHHNELDDAYRRTHKPKRHKTGHLKQGVIDGVMQGWAENRIKQGISLKDDKGYTVTADEARRLGLVHDEFTSGYNLFYGDWRVRVLQDDD